MRNLHKIREGTDARRCIHDPLLQRLVVGACDCDPFTGRNHIIDLPRMSREGLQMLSRSRIPCPHGFITTCAADNVPLRVDANTHDFFGVAFPSAQWTSQPQNTTWLHQIWFIYFDSISSKLKSIFISRTSSPITSWLSNVFNGCLIQKNPSIIHTVDSLRCNLFKIRSILQFWKHFFFLLSILQISQSIIIYIHVLGAFVACIKLTSFFKSFSRSEKIQSTFFDFLKLQKLNSFF